MTRHNFISLFLWVFVKKQSRVNAAMGVSDQAAVLLGCLLCGRQIPK
jgi:hypothetical protein